MRYYPSDNAGKFFIAIPETPKPLDPGNDFHLLMHGNVITVSPMALQIADIAMAEALDGKI
jgi:5'-nucleotidase